MTASEREPSLAERMQRDAEDARYAEWKTTRAQFHEGGRVAANAEAYWTPLTKPLSRARVALISSLGVHHRRDEPFDILAPEGDLSFRAIPGDVDSSDLMATHGHVDTRSANRDINVALPIDRLREAVRSGRIGSSASTHYGFMGFCPEVERMRDDLAPRLIERLLADGVEAVVLAAG